MASLLAPTCALAGEEVCRCWCRYCAHHSSGQEGGRGLHEDQRAAIQGQVPVHTACRHCIHNVCVLEDQHIAHHGCTYSIWWLRLQHMEVYVQQHMMLHDVTDDCLHQAAGAYSNRQHASSEADAVTPYCMRARAIGPVAECCVYISGHGSPQISLHALLMLTELPLVFAVALCTGMMSLWLLTSTSNQA